MKENLLLLKDLFVKSKIYKYMTLISKNVSIDKLDDIVNKYNNTYHRTIKIKSVVVKDNTYIDFNPNMQPFTKYLNITLVSM